MSEGDRSRPGSAADPEAAARARVEGLFAAFDRLTPDELARIGLRRGDEADREALLSAVGSAAAATDRERLIVEARDGAREAVLRRYAEGTLHPTWLALNWGLSQGTVEDRVAIVEALADAAAAAVVADVLDPEVAAALSLDAEQVVGLAAGSASDGALARALQQPLDPELGRSPARRRAFLLLPLAAVVLGALGAGTAPGLLAFGLVLLIAGAIAVAAGRRSRPPARG